MLSRRRIQNIRKLAPLAVPKNRGDLYNDVNIDKSKNWKNGENIENFSIIEKQIESPKIEGSYRMT